MASKRDFSKPKRPSPEAEAKYIANGPGHDTAGGGTRARLAIQLPDELHQRFKLACVRHRTTMQAEMLAAVERRCAELETDGN